MNFIIVEDDSKTEQEIEDIISKVMFKNNKEYQVHKFDKYSKNLKKLIEDQSLNKIYMLDIELAGKISGIDIARDIRANDWDSEIIFITSHDRMFETVYKTIYKVFDFIEKFDNLDKRLTKDIKEIIKMNHDTGKFLYSNNKISLQIFYKDIYYIYRDTQERKLVIVTSNNEFKVSLTLDEIMKRLDSRFIQTHRACIVNDDKVNIYNWNEGYFVLSNNEQIHLLSKNFKGGKND